MSYWSENDDKLGRSKESAYIIRFLTQQVSNRISRGKTGSYVLNIDATWGEGKTFFMKGLFADLKNHGHPAIMIDAWRDDFSNDPLTAVVAEFDNFLKSFKSANRTIKTRVRAAGRDLRRNIGKLTLLSARGIARRATTYVVGEAADEVARTAKELVSGDVDTLVSDATGAVIKFTDAKIDKYAEAKLAQFNEAKNSLDNFQASLEKAVKALVTDKFEPPFFVLVDELDRCRPTYAIEMLERIKHLFEVENVVFILATDTTQLANSVKAVYGSEFDSRHYLTRFFDRTYILAAPDKMEMVAHYCRNALVNIDDLATTIEVGHLELIVSICDQNRLELRQVEKAIELLATIQVVWEENCQIELAIIFPMIVAFIKGNDLFGVDQIRSSFRASGEPIRVANVDLERTYVLLSNFRQTRLVNLRAYIESAYGPSHARHERDKETPTALSIVEHELKVRGRVVSLPLFTSYADRIRMAGRFNVRERI